MSWINAGQFKIADRNGRHYVFRRNNSGNTEINIPASIVTKAQAKRWLKNNPTKVADPTKFIAKKKPQVAGLKPWEQVSPGGKKYVKIRIGGENKLFPAPPSIKRPATAVKWMPPAPPKLPPGLTAWKYPAFRPLNENKRFNLSCDAFKASLTSIKAIGAGRQGKVFKCSQRGSRSVFVLKVAPYDLAAKSRNEPQPFQVEFDNQKAIMDAAPDGVVHVYKTYRCVDFVPQSDLNMKNVQNSAKYNKSRQGIIAMEYCDGGSLTSWIKKNPLSDAVCKKMISQILNTLGEIRVKFPYFNHNDLHMENIFVSTKRGFLVGDFGWSRTKESGTNPAVNTANGTQTASFWGVGPKTDPRYDIHFFLNELRDWVYRHEPSKYPRTTAFLNRVVPSGYRGQKDAHVSEWRLKYGESYPGLPSLKAIMNDPYLSGGPKVANLQMAKARLRKVRTPSPKKLEPIVLRPKKRITSPMLRAVKARLRKTGSVKNVYTNAELVAMGAANFIKLSPKTRERAKKLKAAANKGKMTARLVNKNETKKVATKTQFVMPNKAKKKIPPAIFKTAKFNKLVTQIYTNRGGLNAGENFGNAWNKARTAAINVIQARINANKPAFSPSPPPRARLPSPLSPLGPPPKRKTPSPPKAKKVNFNYKLSPNSGRAKIKAPDSGRYVYANGSSISLEYLKRVAAIMSVNIKGIRSKANIAKKLFGK